MIGDPHNLKEYGLDIGLIISGLFGSILLTSKNSSKNLGKTISSLIGGAASANYITPIVITLAKLDDQHYHYGIAFLLGFLGLKGIEFFSNKLLPETGIEIEEKPEEIVKPVKLVKPVTTQKQRVRNSKNK
jgi:hypothetical protein